jgi:Flp pilus assembly protein TadD
MNELDQRLRASHGYIDIGMFQDAWDELESLPPALRADDAVLETRIDIFMRMGKLEAARVLAESLAIRAPENPGWWIIWAIAVRQEQSVKAAQAVLRRAAEIHPKVPMIAYNRACYACVLGELAEAKELLASAVQMDTSFKKIALDDPDLDAIFGAGEPENPKLP